MIPLTLAEVAAMTGGILDPDTAARPGIVVTGPVVADSRQAAPGALFVAVPGRRVDGHDFAAAAVRAGAVAVLASRPVGVPGVPVVRVEDPVAALGLLARRYLDRLDATVVSITGSSGKTGTKDTLAGLLRAVAPTVAPVGSLNTEIGLPLTVMRADAATHYLVLEASARGIGHIAYLCDIARPRVGVVLNVGSAHLGEFGSPEAIAVAKGELVEALPADGVAVLNADDDRVLAMRERTAARIVTFGLGPDADVRAENVRLDDLARPAFEVVAGGLRQAVTLRTSGAHQVPNALAAAAAALELGVPLEGPGGVAATLSALEPASRWRMEVDIRADGVTVVNDAYNANPQSTAAALRALAAMRGGAAGERRRLIAILGEMAELGDASAAEHERIGSLAGELGVDVVVAVGAAGAVIARTATLAGVPAVRTADDVDAAIGAVQGVVRPGDVVLVKASRSVGLERLAAALLAQEGAA